MRIAAFVLNCTVVVYAAVLSHFMLRLWVDNSSLLTIAGYLSQIVLLSTFFFSILWLRSLKHQSIVRGVVYRKITLIANFITLIFYGCYLTLSLVINLMTDLILSHPVLRIVNALVIIIAIFLNLAAFFVIKIKKHSSEDPINSIVN